MYVPKYKYEVGIKHPTRESVDWIKDLIFHEPLMQGHFVDIKVKPEDFIDKPAYYGFPGLSDHWIYDHTDTIWFIDKVIHCPSSNRSRAILTPRKVNK